VLKVLSSVEYHHTSILYLHIPDQPLYEKCRPPKNLIAWIAIDDSPLPMDFKTIVLLFTISPVLFPISLVQLVDENSVILKPGRITKLQRGILRHPARIVVKASLIPRSFRNIKDILNIVSALHAISSSTARTPSRSIRSHRRMFHNFVAVYVSVILSMVKPCNSICYTKNIE
jgi:hypothetical protein